MEWRHPDLLAGLQEAVEVMHVVPNTQKDADMLLAALGMITMATAVATSASLVNLRVMLV